MKKLEVTKERVIEAALFFPDAKEVLKRLFPKVFKSHYKYSENKVYAFKSSGNIYKLHTIHGKYAWICINTSDCLANGTFATGRDALDIYDDSDKDIKCFDSQLEFAEWMVKELTIKN